MLREPVHACALQTDSGPVSWVWREGASGYRRPVWSWLSRFRVWVANRKLFLWAENWLDPEPRRRRRKRKKPTARTTNELIRRYRDRR